MLRSVASKDSMAAFQGVILDDSQPVLRNVSRRPQSTFCESALPTTIRLPQPLDASTGRDHSFVNRSKTLQRSSATRPARVQEISPIRRVSSAHSLPKSVTTAQIYDPLRLTSSQISASVENGFSSELQRQGDKLMNGLKAILKERVALERQSRPPSYPPAPETVLTALSRAGSSSTVSTGRDHLSKEVRLLREAIAGIDVADRARAGGGSPLPKGDETIPDSFTMPDEVISLSRPASGSRVTSAMEQARMSSRGSAPFLTDNNSRDRDSNSGGMRRQSSVDFHQSPAKDLKEQGVNTQKVPVRRLIITHHVKHDLEHLDRRRNASFEYDSRPKFQPFRLQSSGDSGVPLVDIDSVPHLGRRDDARKAAFDGAAMRRTIHGPEVEERHHLVGHTQHKAVGGKKGRPVFVGRSLHSRGRVHFRPHAHCHLVPRVKVSEANSPDDEQSAHDRRDAATITDEPVPCATSSADAATEAVVEDEVEQESPPHRQHPVPKKHPFVGSGRKATDTFSIAGNQQQVMRVTSTRFQEWMPLVRNIIYDSRCKDYAHALQRDLLRQKRSHTEQIRLLQADLDECRNESERREIRDDITRLKQQWSGKHERVLSSLNEHISKGGVWSKVQQLRTIYAALIS